MKRAIDDRSERGFVAWYGGGGAYDEPPQPPDALHVRGPYAATGPTDRATQRHVGVILGRFRPPHLGHLHLVEHAFSNCGALTVVSPSLLAPAATNLIDDAFSGYASVRTCLPGDGRAPGDPAFATTWASIVRDLVPNVTRLFSSDPLGAAAVARALAVEHIVVDAERFLHRVSSSAIRADLYGRFGWVAPGARDRLAVHVGIVGVENAGKTSLASALAAALGAPVVDDPLRRAAERNGGIPTNADLAHGIDDVPARRHAAAARSDVGVVLVEGCAVTADAWARRLGVDLGAASVRAAAAERYDLWLFCEDDFGFVGPADRDDPAARARMRAALRARLAHEANVVTIAGPPATRRQTALDAITATQAKKAAALAAILG